jgi:hypothetical protein
MLNKVEVFNLALQYASHGQRVASESENSTEAKALNAIYRATIKMILREHTWSFARKRDTLQLTNDAAPLSDWSYEYKFPKDCITFLGISKDSQSNPRVEYEKARNKGGEVVILANQNPAYAVYIADVDEGMDMGFYDCLAWRLAYLICPIVGAGKDRQKLCEEQYINAINKARAADNYEAGHHNPTDPDYLNI